MTTLAVKIVPNDKPNDDGEWREISVIPGDWITVFHRSTRWNIAAALLQPYIPRGFHLVQYSYNLPASQEREPENTDVAPRSRFAGLDL